MMLSCEDKKCLGRSQLNSIAYVRNLVGSLHHVSPLPGILVADLMRGTEWDAAQGTIPNEVLKDPYGEIVTAINPPIFG